MSDQGPPAGDELEEAPELRRHGPPRDMAEEGDEPVLDDDEGQG